MGAPKPPEHSTPAGRRPKDRVSPLALKSLGRYILLQELGSGGMGAVYEAFDPQLDRRVAIKVLRRDRAGGTGARDARERLLREARSMARLSHPNVIQIYDSGLIETETGEEVFLAMEYVQGVDLALWLERYRLDPQPDGWRHIVETFVLAGRGLISAHTAGVVHRDFKPANVLIAEDGRVLVGDFGVARLAKTEIGTIPELAGELKDLTLTGDVVGTPAYMAPEQYRRQPADARSDQFSFCVALYEALWGTTPFQGEHFAARAMAVLSGKVNSPPDEPSVPAHLWTAIRKGLSVVPEERFESMEALLDALSVERKRSTGRLGWVVAAALVASLFAWSALKPGPCSSSDSFMEGVWDEPAKAKVRSSMLSLRSVPYASQVLGEVERKLDAYAEQWVRAHTQACMDTHVHRVQSESLLDRRVACLEDRRRDMRAFIDELRTADPTLLNDAVRAVGELSSIAPCSDLKALRLSVAPPEAPQETFVALKKKLATVRAKIRAGRYAPALTALRELQPQLDALNHEPTRGEALVLEGRLHHAQSRAETAEQKLRAAYMIAQRTGDHALALQASLALIPVVGLERSRPDEGLLWADLAEASGARYGAEPRWSAHLMGYRARVLSAKGNRKSSMQQARKAAELVDKKLGKDTYERATTRVHLGETLMDMRDYRAAYPELLSAIKLLEVHLGKDHPQLVHPLTLMARTTQMTRSAQEAVPIIERAVTLADQHLGKDHHLRADALIRRGSVMMRLRKEPEAISSLVEARRILGKLYGEEHTLVARAELTLGAVHHRLVKVPQALQHYKNALRIRESLLGKWHPDLVVILQNIGALQTEHGDPSLALEGLERGLQIRTTHLSSQRAIADIQYWLGRALYTAQKDKKRGLALVQKSYATMVKLEASPREELKNWLTGIGFPP